MGRPVVSQDDHSHDTRSAPGLVSDALTHLSRIIRGEMSLAQAELAASGRSALRGAALAVVAAVLAVTALNLMSAALVAAVVRAGLAPDIAALVVGAGFAVAAVIAVLMAKSALSPARLTPSRALRGLRRDAETLKEGLTR